MICICRQNGTNLKLPQDSILVTNKPPLLCDCFCGRYHPNKAALQAHCLACNFSLPTDGFCTATCFVFVHLSCFPFFGELKMRNFHTHTNIMWAHLCAIKPCFVFVKVLTQSRSGFCLQHCPGKLQQGQTAFCCALTFSWRETQRQKKLGVGYTPPSHRHTHLYMDDLKGSFTQK